MGSITSRSAAKHETTEPAWPAIGPARRQVFVVAPSCPACGAFGRKALRAIRSKSHADGVVERRTKCNCCDWTFTIIIQPATLAD